MNIQEEFDKGKASVFKIPPGEHQGPLTINRPCTVDGNDATIWNTRGPVLILAADNVVVKNLRVEVTEAFQGAGFAAISATGSNCRLENVEVRGGVRGIAGEKADWVLPRVVNLGSFAAEEKNSFVITIKAPAKAKIIGLLEGVAITPAELFPGENQIQLTLERFRDNTILFGYIMLKTESVLRRISIVGRCLRSAPQHQEMPRVKKEEPASLEENNKPAEEIPPTNGENRESRQKQPEKNIEPNTKENDARQGENIKPKESPPAKPIKLPKEIKAELLSQEHGDEKKISHQPPKEKDDPKDTKDGYIHGIFTRAKENLERALHGSQTTKKDDVSEPFANKETPANKKNGSKSKGNKVVRGERKSLGGIETLWISYQDGGRPKDMEVDGYVFCLREDGRVRGDKDLIFFNNIQSEDGSIRVNKNGGFPVKMNLARIPSSYKKIVVAFSIYESKKNYDFSKAKSPEIRVGDGEREYFRFALENLCHEKTINGVEIYRYKNEWRMAFVGAGYEGGLKRLCENYGLTVMND